MIKGNLKIACLVAFILFYNLFLYQLKFVYWSGLVWPVTVTLLAMIFFLTKKHASRFGTFFGLLAICQSWLKIITANSILVSIDLLATAFWLGLSLVYFSFRIPLGLTKTHLFLTPLGWALKIVRRSFKKIPQLWQKESVASHWWQIGLRSLLLAVPVLLVLYQLLRAADPIFGQLAPQVSNQIFPRLLTSLILTLILAIITGASFSQKLLLRIKSEFNLISELAVTLASVAVLLSFFLIVQFKYLFHTVAEDELQRFGLQTYSEYVRKGFGQLILAAIVVYLLVILSLQVKEVASKKLRPILTWFNLILSGQILLLIASNAKKVYLYQAAHGLTRIRVFGSIFLVWLTLMIFFSLVNNFYQVAKEKILLAEICLTFSVLLVSHLINVDKLIANRFPPTVNQEVDYWYLACLSADAASVWPDIADFLETTARQTTPQNLADPEINRRFFYANQSFYCLNSHLGTLSEKFNQKFKWQGWNLNEKAAWEIVRRHGLRERIQTIGEKFGALFPYASVPINLDRGSNPPLL